MYNDFNAIPKHLRDLCEPGVEQLCLKYGLISFTYDYMGNPTLTEITATNQTI